LSREAALRVGVACSGGLDSTALLHATARAAAPHGVEVRALHVHHGLLPEADAWWDDLEQRCRRWRRAGLPLTFCGAKVAGQPARGDSVEAWARRERYRVLTELAQGEGITLVLLAHHRRDQAETVLLQALRGAGAPGLSAMPRTIVREGITWARPWLDRPREAIEAYLRRYRLAHVVDPSNADVRYARNRLRAVVWPAFIDAFPHAEAALAATAVRMQETARCLDDLARMDAGVAVRQDALMLAPWLELPAARRANLLRHWATAWSAEGLPETLLQRLLTELPWARTGNQWPAPGGRLMLRRGLLRHESAVVQVSA
jgi:tRNA(Ile)-lysidine synthase